jgi:hypothetical protein
MHNNSKNINYCQKVLLVNYEKKTDIELMRCAFITSETRSDKDKIGKDDIFDANRYECKWHAEKIKKDLDNLIKSKYHIFEHNFCYNAEDNSYYVYDNDCYLLVFDEKIELSSERENVFSANKTFTRQIKEINDIKLAYEHFCSITMEDDEG